MRSFTKKAQLQAALAKLKKEIETLEKSESYKSEQSLIRGVEKLLSKYGKTKTELITFLRDGSAPMASKKPAKPKTARKQRKLKVYKNPHTNNVIETRGGNHRVLKTWKAEYPAQNIEEWIIEER